MFARKAEQFGGFVDDQVEKIQADIEAEVGEFLQFQSKLQPYRKSQDLAVRDEANKLYKRTGKIKLELNDNLKFIDDLKEQGLSFGTFTANTGRFYEIKKFLEDFKDHKNDVNVFLESGGARKSSRKSSKDGFLPGNDMIWLAVAGALGLGSVLMKKYRRR